MESKQANTTTKEEVETGTTSTLKNEFESTSRKLASIQLVDDIREHTNADSLALAKILGWQVVIKKDEVRIGDKIVYFEIDSLLPERDWSKFMESKKYRVKTIKLRGEYSQGLILPLSILGENVKEKDFEVGQNVTDLLEVKKYEYDADLPVLCSNKFAKSLQEEAKVKNYTYPSELIEKTDEPRIQSEPEMLQRFNGKAYCATLKYDGTSATYVVDPKNKETFYICSRNYVREYNPEEAYSYIADKYKIKEKLIELDCRYAIQGEIYGPKISKNYLDAKELLYVIFNAKDLKEHRYLDIDELSDLCKKLEIPMVEIIERGDNFDYSIDDLKKLVKGNYPNTKNPREGFVFRLTTEWHRHGRESFKIISEDFLIKHHGK